LFFLNLIYTKFARISRFKFVVLYIIKKSVYRFNIILEI
jgi:hypothetical protein